MSACACCSTPLTAAEPGQRVHEARGLCEPCYRIERYHGRLDEYPRRTWSRDELMAEWELLRREGHTRLQAAERLGMNPATFDRALQRARAAGDPRAVLGVAGGITATRAAVERARDAIRAATEQPPVMADSIRSRELEHAR